MTTNQGWPYTVWCKTIASIDSTVFTTASHEYLRHQSGPHCFRSFLGPMRKPMWAEVRGTIVSLCRDAFSMRRWTHLFPTRPTPSQQTKTITKYWSFMLNCWKYNFLVIAWHLINAQLRSQTCVPEKALVENMYLLMTRVDNDQHNKFHIYIFKGASSIHKSDLNIQFNVMDVYCRAHNIGT